MIKQITFACISALCVSQIVAITELNNKASFNQAIQNNDLVVVDFFMVHCGPCKLMAPFLDQLAQQLPNITFFKVNITTVDGLTSRYNVRGVPCLIFFKHGVEIGRHVGCGANTTVASLSQEIRTAFGI